jgi:hypothetical protein
MPRQLDSIWRRGWDPGQSPLAPRPSVELLTLRWMHCIRTYPPECVDTRFMPSLSFS